tara:strand:+ start:3270 stop:3980 length:711 start_codon:yes stop_codon:yes gene_type:complete
MMPPGHASLTDRAGVRLHGMLRLISSIVLHHAAAPRTTTQAQLTSWHKARGINAPSGYHEYVYSPDDSNVEVWPQRDHSVMGAHAKGFNQGSIGICMGWNAEERPVPELLWETTMSLLADLCQQYELTSEDVHLHRNVGSTPTVCPGKHVDIRQVRAAVDRYLTIKEAPVPLDATEALSATEALIEFAEKVKAAAADLDGEEKSDGTKRRFSRSELKGLAKEALRVGARILLDVID